MLNVIFISRDIFALINFSVYLFNISVSHFSQKTKKEQQYFNKTLKSYNYLLELTASTVGDDFLPCQSENTPHLEISPSITSSLYLTVTLPGKPDLNSKNKDLELDKNTEKTDTRTMLPGLIGPGNFIPFKRKGPQK